MRWYCLHPELPEKAVLRIRTAPNSSASVSGRVSKGKAVAALAPEFEIADESLSLARSAGGAPQRWLHVSFPDELSGAPTEGYVMASLPDGMRLLVPWEQADFINCCYIKNASAKVFDGPLKTSAAVGLAEEGEGVKYPFGVAAVEGSRACILHDVLDSVWIEIAELEPVCVHLRHPNCSTPHAFYTLNEDLPPEAQIAIRCFPSKDAETVGLLSRGEVIEVVAQCGNWMQVAAAQDEEGGEDSWIMWQTDSWTLLVEFPERSSATCTRHTTFLDRVAENGTVIPDPAMPEVEHPDAFPAANSEMLHPTEDVAMSIADDSVFASHLPTASALAAPTDDTSSRDEVEGLNDQFRDQSSLDEADAEMDEDRVKRDNVEEIAGHVAEERVVPTNLWDERPLSVRSNPGNGDSSSDKFEHADQFQKKQSSSPEDDGSESEPVVQHSSSSECTAASWDDRPIRPQKQINCEESVPPAQEFDEVQTSDNEDGAQEEDGESKEEAAADSVMTQPRDEAESDQLTSESGTKWDETPVGGGKPFLWDESPIRHPSTAASDKFVDPSYPDQATDNVAEEDDIPTEAVSPWDETPVGGSGHRAWDETPVGVSGHRSWEETPVGGGKSLPWDELPVGAQSHENSHAEEAVVLQPESMNVDKMQDEEELLGTEAVVAHDEIPVGAGNSRAWDETPAVIQNLSITAGQHDEEMQPVPMTVDAAEESGDDQVMQTEIASSSWDETPVGGTGSAPRPWDEVPVGGGRKSQIWDEFPPGHQSAPDGSGDAVDKNEETRADSMVVDGVEGEDEDEQEQVAEATLGSAWDETPVGGSRRVWDETPVGGASSRHPWDDMPVGAHTSVDLQQEVNVELIEPDTHSFADNPARSRLARMLESDLLSSVYSSASSTHVDDVDQGQPGKLTLADLDEPAEATPTWADASVQGTPFETPIRSHDYTPNTFQHEAEEDDMPNAEIPGDDWVDGTPSHPIMPTDTPIRDNHRWEDEQAPRKPVSIEGSGLVMFAEDMVVDSAEEDGDHDSSQPVWGTTPVEPAPSSHPGASAGYNGQLEEDEEEYHDSQDAETQLPGHMEAIPDDMPIVVIQGAQSVSKRESAFGNVARRVENRSSANGTSFAGRRTRKPGFWHSENVNGGLSFLMEFGIRAYCRHKQILITSNEEVSRILFEAVVYGDDPEIILEALTADEPPCEDWMTFSPSKVRVVSSEPDPSHNFLDVLYARDSNAVPVTPKQLTLQQSLRTPPHSSGARKVKIDRMFNRTPVKQRPTPTYDLIMNNADVDKILEAEFGNEACELSILGPYKYPTLSGSRMIGKSSRSPVGDFSMAMSGLNRFSSAMQTSPTTTAASKASIAPGHALRTSEDVPPRMSTPPMEEMTNPLKRAASAIAKTPPVHDAKAATAASAVPATAAQPSAKQPSAALPPPASRLGSRLSSTVSSLGASSALRRPSSQPSSSSEQAPPRPRSSLTSAPSTTVTRSSIAKTLPKPGQSLLQRKSFLPTPSPAKSVATPSASVAGQIAQATDTSSMAARRTSFGFVRPKPAVPTKK